MGVINDFLATYKNRSEATRRTYTYAIRRYFEFIYDDTFLDKRRIVFDQLEARAEQYFEEQRDYGKDFLRYVDSILVQPPKTVSTYLAALRKFFTKSKHPLTESIWEQVKDRRPKGRRARTRDRVPSNKEFRLMLDHMPLQGKALYLLMASSGIRLGEALSLEFHDIEFDTMNYFDIRNTKSGERRDGFCSDEAKEYVQKWMEYRHDWLNTAIARSTNVNAPRDTEDQRVFPFTPNTARTIWNNSCEKVGNGKKDRETGRRMMHPHVLRKFCRTRLGAVISRDIVEAILGHEEYLDQAYRRHTTPQLWEEYQKGMHTLLIYGSATEDLSKIRTMEEIISRLSIENASLSKRFMRLEQENADMKQIQAQVAELHQQLHEIQQARSDTDEIMNQVFQNPDFRRVLRKTLRELES
jgi:integrase